jgi:ribosomal protein L34E
MVSRDILYSVSKTPTGQLVKAGEAEKGVSHFCPACNQTLILRKGTQKRPHFAHKVLSHNCTPETALHYSFKTLLFSKIQKHINQQLPLEMQWNCSTCGGKHTGNLLKKAVTMKLEHNLGTCRPDIALLDKKGRTVAVIEVVVTHHIEQAVLDYYKSNHIPVVSYELQSDEDVNRLNTDILTPDNVNVCMNPKCPKCGNHMSKKYLLIIDGDCWKCGAPMKVAALRGDQGYEGDFSQYDIQIAIQHGVFMKSHYSRTAERRYTASTCTKCGAFVGNHYLFTDYVAVLSYNRQEIDVGYYCPHCSVNFDDSE